LPSFFT